MFEFGWFWMFFFGIGVDLYLVVCEVVKCYFYVVVSYFNGVVVVDLYFVVDGVGIVCVFD